MEKERHKTKVIENKFKIYSQNSFDKVYSRKKPPQSGNVGTTKYTPLHMRGGKLSLEAQRIKEGKCKYCG